MPAYWHTHLDPLAAQVNEGETPAIIGTMSWEATGLVEGAGSLVCSVANYVLQEVAKIDQ